MKIFNHWQTVMNHPAAKLDETRKRKIRIALKNYDEDQLCEAVIGCSLSPFHMGKNDSGMVHDDISLILRDSKNIEKFIQIAKEPPTKRSKAEEELRDKLAEVKNWYAPKPANEAQGVDNET